MRKAKIENYRNIGIMAHIDAGKTTLSERILFYSGVLHKMGETHDGGATTDWMAQEKERGITITSACVTTNWGDKQINIIDTPGHVDFTVEVERSLKVLDGAITVLSAREGVQPQSETVWRQANKYKVPRMVFVNKMDINDADFYRAIQTLRTNLNANPVPISLPVGKEKDFTGIIDLVDMKYYHYNNIYAKDGKLTGTTMEVREIPADMKSKAEEYRTKMIEAAAEQDDVLLEKYFGGEELTTEEIKMGLRKGTLNLNLNLVACGTALGNKGVEKLLDAVCDYMPSPVDIPAIKGVNPDTNTEEERKAGDNEPFSGLAFKVMANKYGEVVFFRVYSGTLDAGSYVYNSTKDKKERVGRLVQMKSNEMIEIDSVCAGDIAAIVGLKDTTTADTLCDEKKPIVLESMNFAEPVIKLAIEPKSKDMQEKMINALIKLSSEDPTFKVSSDKETGQTIIAGMGELHLDIMIDRLKREFNVEVNQGEPQVSYKETFKQKIETEGKYVKQSGGKGQYGHCWLRIEPQEAGAGFTFADETVGGSIPKEYIPAVEKGLLEAKMVGVLAGYETVDFKVTVFDGSFHPVDSSEMAFKIAASMALKDGIKKATPILLEPITRVQVTLPDEYLGAVMGNLTTRRGQLQGVESQGGMQIINAEVPLSEMFGYVTDLRSNTQGRGTFTMEVVKYDEVPSYVAEKIIKARTK